MLRYDHSKTILEGLFERKLEVDYVPEEEYSEELWNEQKKSGERNRAAMGMRK